MSRKVFWLVVNGLMVLTLIIAACAPAAVEEQKPAPVVEEKKPTPVVEEKKQEVPVKEAVASQSNMVKATLTKLDGTKVEKMVEKPKYGGTLNRLGAQSNVWDPRKVSYGTHVLYLERLLKGDYARGPLGTGELSWDIFEYFSMSHFRGSLAESWEMPDDTTIIYHIRRGVRWALDDRAASKLVGGRELTADDVVFSFKWLVFAEPQTFPRQYFASSKLTSITATDKYTVVVKAPTKLDLSGALGYISDMIVIVPHEVIEKYGTFNTWDQAVGTGPFMIKDYVPGSVATWVKNPNYWGYDPVLGKDYPNPYVDAIKMLDIPDISTQQAALRTGKIDDAVTVMKEEVAPILKTAPHLKTKIVAFGTGSNRIVLQMNDKKAPWQDIRVRRALLMAINHQEIVDTYYGGAADSQAFPLPGAPELYALGWAIPMKELPRETQELFEYHPDKAKALLKEAGYPNGFKTSILIVASDVDQFSIIKDYWAKIGVDLTLDVREAGVVANLSRVGTYPDMTTASRWGTATLYSKYETPPSVNNEGNINDLYIQKLRRQMFEVFWETEKRTPIMRELYAYSLSQAYYLPLPSKWSYRLYQPWLKNYDAESSIGYGGKSWPYVWLDLDLKKKLGY